MDVTFDAVRRIVFIDLPSLPVWAKLPISLIIAITGGFILLALWKTPSTAADLDPATTSRLSHGVVAFFQNVGEAAPSRAIVFGEAKGIVRRMRTESDIFPKVQMEIETRKKNDNNWTFANQLNEALALVNALGLTPETVKEDQIFLQLPLPDIP